ncbi:chromate transporter [Leucobacter exalbidus]|uniref:Chromate transporter n=1 Tax=Leucobacter exalbidus TaxID=662960 RepID=A0A940PMI8_9MICO|nr:chromate efflux transporter [Leucobacter exalbidus]MBP1325883.1 chromate transporter [Leucobacter exalbidus]
MTEVRSSHPGTATEVFWAFLKLGVTAFGGPVAHLGYFRETFVERRKWLDDRAYADLVALCQFLPGPASSQVGMALGLQRAGLRGLIAAWVAFTLPSAMLLLLFAYGVTALGDLSDAGWILGLQAAAVAVVAHAVLGMAKSLTPDAQRATIAVVSLAIVLLVPGVLAQVAAIIAAGIAGLIWLRAPDRLPPAPSPSTASPHEAPQPAASPAPQPFAVRVPKALAISCLAAFAALLTVLPLAAHATGNAALGLFNVFARAGALVFGGGHVVLPLLEADTVGTGLVTPEAFLAGYGAAQAVPGPLFTFAAFLGGVATEGPTGVLGAAIALVAIFLPAGLLVVGVLPFWDRIRTLPLAQRALMGVNAGVVGILAAALYTPVFTTGITGIPTLVLAAAAFVALTAWKCPAWAVVIAAGLLGWLLL